MELYIVYTVKKKRTKRGNQNGFFCYFGRVLYSTDGSFVILQLLRIEEELGDKAVYAGLKFRKPAEPY